MDEIKEQLAVYSRLYYNKRRNDGKIYAKEKGICTTTQSEKEDQGV